MSEQLRNPLTALPEQRYIEIFLFFKLKKEGNRKNLIIFQQEKRGLDDKVLLKLLF